MNDSSKVATSIFKEESKPDTNNIVSNATTPNVVDTSIPSTPTKESSNIIFFNEIRKTFLRSLNVNTYFILLYTIVVIVDGVYDLHINANEILIGYTVIVGKNLINHGINSVLNSKSGEMPVKQDPLVIPTVKPPTNTCK